MVPSTTLAYGPDKDDERFERDDKPAGDGRGDVASEWLETA